MKVALKLEFEEKEMPPVGSKKDSYASMKKSFHLARSGRSSVNGLAERRYLDLDPMYQLEDLQADEAFVKFVASRADPGA